MLIFFATLAGLIAGSFINAAVPRIREKDFAGLLTGRSHCPHCRHELSWKDLLPVASYLALRGHCRYCDKKIGARYLAVELITAATFAGIASFSAGGISLLVWQLFFAAVLIFLAVYDYETHEIPDEISLPAAGLALGSNLLPFTLSFGESAIGALVGGGFFLAIVLMSNGKWMGGGDIRLGLLLGALLGWQIFVVALFLASVAGAAVGSIAMKLGKKEAKSEIPFAPFLAFGGIVALLFGQQIWWSYLGLVF